MSTIARRPFGGFANNDAPTTSNAVNNQAPSLCKSEKSKQFLSQDLLFDLIKRYILFLIFLM